jgi:hypothetical protein
MIFIVIFQAIESQSPKIQTILVFSFRYLTLLLILINDFMEFLRIKRNSRHQNHLKSLIV